MVPEGDESGQWRPGAPSWLEEYRGALSQVEARLRTAGGAPAQRHILLGQECGGGSIGLVKRLLDVALQLGHLLGRELLLRLGLELFGEQRCGHRGRFRRASTFSLSVKAAPAHCSPSRPWIETTRS